MQAHSSVRGYSDFFASGFRAVTTRPPSVGGSSRNSLEPITNALPSQSSSSSRRSFAGIGQRRPRPTSMFVSSSISSPSKPVPEQREKPTTRASHGRRSSFVSFSSRLFERMTSSNADENSTISSSRRSSRSFRFFGSSDEALPEVWITTGGPHTPSAPNGSAALHQSIDPFSSSPDTRSMFIDLSSSDSSPSGTPKRESFLSLTGTGTHSPSSPSPSTSTRSYSSLLFTRRERPTSIHTMPLPSRSRRSSFSMHYRSPSQEKSDFFLIVEEEEPASLANEPILENDHEEWPDAPAKIDWRQFHIDILTDEGQ